MNKIKILYISHSPYFNGAEICLLTLLKYINRDRFEPVVIFPSDGPLVEEIRHLSIKSYILPLEKWIRFPFDESLTGAGIDSRSRKIAEIIDNNDIQLVHTNTTVILDGAVAAKIKNIPHVWHVHESLQGHPELKPILPLPLIYWAMSFLSDNVVIPAHTLQKQFDKIINPAKLKTIFNGSERIQDDQSDGSSLRSELGLDDNHIVGVTIGGVTERKGYANLLRAVSLARSRNCDINIFWVGPASEERLRDFYAKATEWNIRDLVHYLGFRRDIPSVLKNADFYVLPSANEVFPMVILEAMAAGKAVIATDCGGVKECVVDGETGFIVPVNDPESLSNRMNNLATNKIQMRIMGEKGRKRFTAKFTAELFAKRFEKVYLALLANKKKPVTTREQQIFKGFLDAYQSHSDNLRVLVEKDLQLRDKDKTVVEKLQQITVKDSQLAEKDQFILTKDRQLEEKDHILSERLKQIAEKDRQIFIKNKELGEKELLLIEKDRKCTETQQKLVDIVNSRSWRITAPLRRLKLIVNNSVTARRIK